MVNQKQLDKLISLYEESKGVCVYKNAISCDSNGAAIWINKDILYFQFDEDEVEDFKFNVNEIEDIIFDAIGNTTVSIIVLANGDEIYIHNL